MEAEGFLSFLHQPLTEENIKKVCARAAYERLLAGDMSLLEPEKLPLWWHTSLLEGKLEYTYLDLDGDGVEELLLQWINEPGEYNGVFHYDGGRIYCWQHDEVERVCWDHPLRDGTMVTEYHLSGNYSYTLFRYQEDGNREQVASLCSRSESIGNDDLGDRLYEVDGQEVSQTEFERELKRLITDQMLNREAWTALPASEPLSEDAVLLMVFLRGESEAAVDESFYNGGLWDDTLLETEPFTVQELFQQLGERIFSEEDRPQGEMSYALMKTLGGREMLVLCHYGKAAIGPFTYLVFGVFDGQVRMTYAVTYSYRFLVDLCQSLVFSAQGSGGAGYHYHWAGYIDETGHYKSLYQNGEILSGVWAFGYAKIDDESLYDESFELSLLEMDGTKYYELGQWFEGDGPLDPALLARIREHLDGEGMTETDSVDDLIADAYVACGFSAKPESYDGPWLSLALNQ